MALSMQYIGCKMTPIKVAQIVIVSHKPKKHVLKPELLSKFLSMSAAIILSGQEPSALAAS